MPNQNRRHWSAALFAALVLLTLTVAPLTSTAWAQQEDRAVPNYDGREEADATAGDVLVWIPRVVFYPVYLVTEYLVRWPVGTTVTWLEREHVLERIADFFAIGDAPGDFGFFPTAFVEFGLRASIGFYVWGEGLPTPHDQSRLHFAWGGKDWWLVSARQRFSWGEKRSEGTDFSRNFVGVEFELDYRPDNLFDGLETNGTTHPTRFFWDQLGGQVDAELVFGQGDGLVISSGVHRNTFGRGLASRESGERSIEQVFDVHDEDMVPGFEGYTLSESSLRLVLDTRPPPTQPGSGLRVEAFGSFGADLGESERVFLGYGADVAFFLDLSGRNHTIGLRERVELAEPLGDLPVPFVEQVALGGNYIRGFEEGRFRGSSGTVTTLQYTYPIWVFLDGIVFAEAGNTFGERFEGFALEDLRGSFGIGVRNNNDRDVRWDILIGFGTSPFGADSFNVEEVRFLLGLSRGV